MQFSYFLLTTRALPTITGQISHEDILHNHAQAQRLAQSIDDGTVPVLAMAWRTSELDDIVIGAVAARQLDDAVPRNFAGGLNMNPKKQVSAGMLRFGLVLTMGRDHKTWCWHIMTLGHFLGKYSSESYCASTNLLRRYN